MHNRTSLTSHLIAAKCTKTEAFNWFAYTQSEAQQACLIRPRLHILHADVDKVIQQRPQFVVQGLTACRSSKRDWIKIKLIIP